MDHEKPRRRSGDQCLVDAKLNEDWVAWQLHVYWLIAWHLYKSGLHVVIHPYNTAHPFAFSDIVKALEGKSKKAKLPVLPKGVKMGGEKPTLRQWAKAAAPPAWRKKIVARGK